MSGDLLVVGMSHRTSPVEVRERLAIDKGTLGKRALELKAGAGLPEVLVLSTCNRVEVYVGGEDRERSANAVRDWLADAAGTPVSDFLYVHHGAEAARHVFRVASSLDSMVVGEPQILGQVKEAYAAARESRAIGTLLDRCFSTAFAVAKRVRSQTSIAEGSVSVSSIAGDLAKKIFGDLDDRRVLLIGAGEMGEAAAKHLRQVGASLYIVNRSIEKAEALAAAHGGHGRGLEALGDELSKADVAIASTASKRFVLTPELMRGVIKARRHRPLFLIDIAVPRDVDPRVGELSNVFLYDVDDLEQVAQENLSARHRSAAAAEAIVSAEVTQFEKWRRSGSLTPTIVALRARVRGVLAAELERGTKKMDLSERERRSMEKMLDAMTNKLLHPTITELKAAADSDAGVEAPDARALLQNASRLFGLEASTAERGDRERDPERSRVERLEPSGGKVS